MQLTPSVPLSTSRDSIQMPLSVCAKSELNEAAAIVVTPGRE